MMRIYPITSKIEEKLGLKRSSIIRRIKKWGLEKAFSSPNKIFKEKVGGEFDKALGGYKIYILNHAKEGEFKFNIVDTRGYIYKMNDPEEFFIKLAGLFLSDSE